MNPIVKPALLRRAACVLVAQAGLIGLSFGQEQHPLQHQLSGTWHYWFEDNDAREIEEDVSIDPSVLTDAAKAYQETFDPERDDPQHSCRPVGTPNLTRVPFALEIVNLGDKLYILSALLGSTRRIYLDDNGPEPDFSNQYGFSTGIWENDMLVVTTTHISEQPFIGSEGLPYSGDPDAHVIERYHLEDDGQTLVNEITVVDPRYYIGGAHLQIAWKKSDAPIIIDDCFLATY